MRAFKVLLAIVLAIVPALVVVAPAAATDANSMPPQVKLTAAGSEALIGPSKTTLAHFSTEAPDPSWEYSPGSEVTVACAIDGRGVPCAATYFGCCGQPGTAIPTSGSTTWSPLARLTTPGLGYYTGEVAVPKWLSSGPHSVTVTVTATDEDGTGPPASVTATYDRTPPAAPELTQFPPRVSHLRKPIFRFATTDDIRLVGKRGEIFRAALRRLEPSKLTYRQFGSGSFMSTWGPSCPTLRSCSSRSQAVYEGYERNLVYGVPERLVAGLYEFRVRARDAVGNESPLTTYRFRIRPGKGRAGEAMIRK